MGQTALLLKENAVQDGQDVDEILRSLSKERKKELRDLIKVQEAKGLEFARVKKTIGK